MKKNLWKNLNKANPWKTDLTKLSNDELWEHFKELVKTHDWWFAMSDDHRVWVNGITQQAHLKECSNILGKLDASRRNSILEKYAPVEINFTDER
jgi:hypothetical protein